MKDAKLEAARAAEREGKRKVVTFVLAALFQAADRARPEPDPAEIAGFARSSSPASAFDAAEAFLAEAAARGISIDQVLAD